MFSYTVYTTVGIITVLAYLALSSAGMVAQARLVAIFGALFISHEFVLYALMATWNYLVDNSFCPWIMIFRGRENGPVWTDVYTNIINLSLATDTYNFCVRIVNILSMLVELIGGPALGIFIMLLSLIVTFKMIATLILKLFNRK